MNSRLSLPARVPLAVFTALLLVTILPAQQPAPSTPVGYDPDTKALLLARTYLQGGEEARPALLEALQRMGWGVRNAKGEMLRPPPAGSDTGLALRDYELEELLWKPGEQPSIRLISLAQALAIPFEDVDAEELAQDLVATIRTSAESTQPQQRFWARFIVALGQVSPANYDLTKPAPPPSIPPDERRLKQLAQSDVQELQRNPLRIMELMQPTPLWADDDPVLAPSPRPNRSDDDKRSTTPERDVARMNEISQEMGKVSEGLGSGNPDRIKAAQERMNQLNLEMVAISQRMQSAMSQQMTSALKPRTDDDTMAPRFMAEWRDQPLSLLQVALITRVLAADLRQAAQKANSPTRRADARQWPLRLPMAAILVAQAAGGAGTSFSQEFSGAAGDIWATGWGAYTGAVLDHHLPDSKFGKGVGIANTLIAWFKTIMSVARQKITLEVENAPLVRTKTRTPGEQRTARAKVEIDFPKGDALKAIRAAMNLTSLDLQLPDGGPVSGAKVVWRLPEGGEGTKYETKNGGWAYRPELAVVQFARAGSNAAYISMTNDAGEATITLEGKPQRKDLSKNVRRHPRRAVVAVEVTIKVGNLTQDLNDAINTAMGGPISGGLSFIADMILRTSFFFQKGREFEVTDWKEPAWEGEFKITIAGAGSKHIKGVKGGPDTDLMWKMDRFMEGRMHTPEWEEEAEQQKQYTADGRHRLEVDGDSRYFRLNDSSSSKTRNSENRYEAIGPIQIQPPGHNQLEIFSRAEPSGNATLLFTGDKMVLDLEPFFGAQCIVGRFEQSGSRTSSKAGTQYLSLLDGVTPSTFSIVETVGPDQETIEGSKDFAGSGSLPYVPTFDINITVKYRLHKNGPPPNNKEF